MLKFDEWYKRETGREFQDWAHNKVTSEVFRELNLGLSMYIPYCIKESDQAVELAQMREDVRTLAEGMHKILTASPVTGGFCPECGHKPEHGHGALCSRSYK